MIQFEELRVSSSDTKDNLQKALEEMELYANLFEKFEEKIKQAEEAKIKAENERDISINDTKVIRQRYINLIGAEKNQDLTEN